MTENEPEQNTPKNCFFLAVIARLRFCVFSPFQDRVSTKRTHIPENLIPNDVDWDSGWANLVFIEKKKQILKTKTNKGIWRTMKT